MLVDIFNNLLSETNQAGWTQLQTMSSGSQTLLQNAERYGKIFASSLSSTDKSRVVMRDNISECIELLTIHPPAFCYSLFPLFSNAIVIKLSHFFNCLFLSCNSRGGYHIHWIGCSVFFSS